MTWRTVPKRIVAGAFRFWKSSSALLIHMNSKYHKSDAFQAAIQLLVVTTKETYMSTQAVCAKRLNVVR